MNWCDSHWQKLRAAIELRGLSKFIATDGSQAAQNMRDQLDGEKEKFDPLMGSWIRINTTFLESPNCAGRFMACPLCCLEDDGRPELVDNWIDGCTDAALQYAIEQDLIKAQ